MSDHNPIDEVFYLLRGKVRGEVAELKAARQRQDEVIVELRREIEDLKRRLMPPPRLSVTHPDRRRARRAEVKFADAPEGRS